MKTPQEITPEQEGAAVRQLLIEAYGIDQYIQIFNESYWKAHEENKEAKKHEDNS